MLAPHVPVGLQDPRGLPSRVDRLLDYVVSDGLEDASREVQFAIALRPNDANVQYNVACVWCAMHKVDDAVVAIKRAWDNGFKDADWARRDPDLALLRGHPEFERLYPGAQP